MKLQSLNLKEIKDKRIKLGISLQEMADLLGFKNASTYLKYEKGQYSFKANQLPLIVEKLECTLEDLFFYK